MIRAGVLCLAVLVCTATAGWAQDAETLADIRQDLSVLRAEIQSLKRELSTTSSSQGSGTGGSVLDRVSAIEAELQRLTAQTERLDFRVQEIVRDGTNRIGDLEFRLLELEGGDFSTLDETQPLGGGATVPPPVITPPVSAPTDTQGELALGEEADFEAAKAALAAGEARKAADGFAAFLETYPGSPLMVEAMYQRGEALRAAGDAKGAARSYLDSFSADARSPVAPDALLGLGTMLGALGAVDEACRALGEVSLRYPASAAVQRAENERLTIGCP